MKKLIYITVLMPILMFAQTQTENYTKTSIYKVIPEIPGGSVANNDKLINITYYDGLGRPVQKIAHKQSGLKNDIITPIKYDLLGRQKKEYLPYARQIPEEKFDNSMWEHLEDFYTRGIFSLTGNHHFETTEVYYTEKQFDDSPINRVLKQAAQGESWALGSGHEVKMGYHRNALNEVRKFKVQFPFVSTTDMHTLLADGFYSERELYKNIVKDENWIDTDFQNKTTEEFTNKEGQLVLKRMFNENLAHDTYYVYDTYGNFI